jgi:RNA polymerase sigma-70 factor (ECF subfamily)
MNMPNDFSDPTVRIKNWVGLYSDTMYTWAYYKTGNKETAEDLVQDTFLSACQSIHAFEGRSDPKTWLLGILKNKIAEHFRKIYRSPVLAENPETKHKTNEWLNNFFDEDGSWNKDQRPSEWIMESKNPLDDAEFLSVLQDCMGKLPSNWNAAIQLKYLEERKGDLICQELQISPTNFWQMLHRAKLQLRRCLEIHWFKKL